MKLKDCYVPNKTIDDLINEESEIEKYYRKACGILLNKSRAALADYVRRLPNPLPKLKGLVNLLQNKLKYHVKISEFSDTLYINDKIVPWDDLEKYA